MIQTIHSRNIINIEWVQGQDPEEIVYEKNLKNSDDNDDDDSLFKHAYLCYYFHTYDFNFKALQ